MGTFLVSWQTGTRLSNDDQRQSDPDLRRTRAARSLRHPTQGRGHAAANSALRCRELVEATWLACRRLARRLARTREFLQRHPRTAGVVLVLRSGGRREPWRRRFFARLHRTTSDAVPHHSRHGPQAREDWPRNRLLRAVAARLA